MINQIVIVLYQERGINSSGVHSIKLYDTTQNNGII